MRWKLFLVPFLLTSNVAARAGVTSNDNPRSVNITLTPVVKNDKITAISGELVLRNPVKRNETLVVLPITIAGQPSAQYDNKTLTAEDSKGKLKLLTSDGTGSDGQPTRFWRTTRSSHGPITVRFKAEPRKTFPSRVGPLFDLRENGGGMLGSVWALVPAPNNDTREYDFSLRWNLKKAPSGTTAAWTWGEGVGPIAVSGPRSQLLYTFFAVGPLSSYRSSDSIPSQSSSEAASHDFGMYWLEQPPFNVTSVAGFIGDFFDVSAEFWREEESIPYRVFIRRNAESGSGGTALLRSFTFGWHDANSTTEEALRLLLAHEMTHNWASMPVASALISRWAEGMAEYYSLRLMWRAGLLDAEKFVAAMNERLESYYLNPTVNMTDEEAYAVAWQRREAQRIPYGRGLIELANLDARLRSQSDGSQNLDALTLQMRELCETQASECTPSSWVEILEEHLGSSAAEEYESISSGKPLLQPIDNSLGPCFDVVQTGSDPVVWQWAVKEGVDISSKTCII